jgi:hypothetical protein
MPIALTVVGFTVTLMELPAAACVPFEHAPLPFEAGVDPLVV